MDNKKITLFTQDANVQLREQVPFFGKSLLKQSKSLNSEPFYPIKKQRECSQVLRKFHASIAQ